MVYNFLKIYFWIQCAKNCSILPSFFSLPLLCSYIPSLISSYFLFCTVFVFGISFIKWIGNYFHLLFPERDIVELWQGCPQKMWGLEIPLLEVLKIQIQFPWYQFSSFSSVAQSCPTLCDPMNRSVPGLPVHHTPRVYPNSCASSRWCHPTISSSVIPFSSCPQSLPASGSFPMSQRMRWTKYWSFSLSISRSNEHPRLVSFRVD